MNINKIFLESLYKLDSKEKTLKEHSNTQKEKVATSLQLNKKNLKTIETILERVDTDIKDLNTRLRDAITVLKNAIVGERNMTGYIYSTNIPINTNYTSDKSNALIKDGIAFGTDNNAIIKEGDTLPISVITNINTNISYTSNTINNILLNTVGKDVVELELKVENYIGNYLVLNFLDFYVIEILENSQIVIEKSLIKNKMIPINKETITIRFHCKNNKPIKIETILTTNKIYSKTVIFESIPVSINKQLEYISLDICDNNDRNHVSIEYYLKINNRDYEIISNTSNKLKEYQNIIKTNKDNLLQLEEIKGKKYKEDFYKFPLSLPTEPAGYTTKVYIKNSKEINNQEVYFIVTKDTILIKDNILLNIGNKLYIDNKEVVQDTVLLTKGIHSLVVLDSSDNVSSFNYEEIKNISDSIFIDKLEKEIIKESSNYYIRLSNTDLIKGYDLLDTEEFSIFLENNKTTEYIENIQLKAELKSNDTKTCPFISKIIVRGI